MCLAETCDDRVPTTASSRMLLKEAGLGEKVVTVPDMNNCNLQKILVGVFPKLKSAGGFELMRCIQNTRDLEVIPTRISGCARLLKCQVGNGKIYIRPIQRNLSLELEEDNLESHVTVSDEYDLSVLNCLVCQSLQTSVRLLSMS